MWSVHEPRVTPWSINCPRLRACIFVGSLSIRRPMDRKGVGVS